MSNLISVEECLRLYDEFGTPLPVRAHCKAVSDAAVIIGEAFNSTGLSFDLDLLRIAGLIHDLLRVEEDHDVKVGEYLDSRGYKNIGDVVRNHMHYRFNPPEDLNEADILALADRLVKEDTYVGIDERVEYLIHKPGESPERTARLLEQKAYSKEYIKTLEVRLGRTIDSFFLKGDEETEKRLLPLLNRVEKPARYIGSETNMAFRQTKNKLRFAFCFPDIYEIGMSYMGLQILYNIINKMPDVYLERAFEPAKDMAQLLREENLPLFTLETKTPLNKMDVVGFTLQYEMSYTNILDMLNLAEIPTLAKDRREEDPLLIAGGPCAYNPEPLADFFDAFLIGDGEKYLPEFLSAYKKAKDEGKTKKEFLESRAGDIGLYIPSFYSPIYNEDGTIKEYEKLSENAPDRVVRALIPDMEEIDFPKEPIVPFIDTVHDRAVVETFRGCTRGCRFCQAGMIYRPVRERSTERIMELAINQLSSTGHDELSLLSLSTSDYSDFENMATNLMHKCKEMNVALSLPSLRLDSFSFSVLQEIQKYRKSGLTFAPEAGTQRLRDVINKGITEEDIYSATRQAVELGWNNIKLYFMIGLPTETMEDLDGIANIARNIVNIHKEVGRGGRFNVTVSVSNFVPKAHTPFQWAAQDSLENLRRKHDYLKGILKIKGVSFQYHDDMTSLLEGILARGDRRVSKVLINAYNSGCTMDAWSENFDPEKWNNAIKDAGLTLDFYNARERSLDEVLPWDIIDSSIRKEYLILEWEKSKKGIVTPDCRYGCTGCGINSRTKCKLGGIYG